MRKLFPLLFVVAALVVVVGCSKETPLSSDSSMDSATIEARTPARMQGNLMAEYEVVIENLTPNNGNGASQPFSPPILATHALTYHVFQEGKYASDELRQVAEDAVGGPMVTMLSTSPFVNDVAEGGGVILPGKSASFMIKAKVGFRKLSLVAMLVNTNDGFVGIDGLRLPAHGSQTYYLDAYDAGTEKNTEMKAHIPGPCCGSPGVRVPTHEKIDTHDGIEGVGDLDPAVWGWKEPTAKLTITLKSIG